MKSTTFVYIRRHRDLRDLVRRSHQVVVLRSFLTGADLDAVLPTIEAGRP